MIFLDIQDVHSNRKSVGGKSLAMDKDRVDELYGMISSLMTKSDIDKLLDKKLEKLRKDIKAENRALVEQLEGRIFDLEKENDVLKKKVETLENQAQNNEKFSASMDYKLNELEQQGRKNSIRIVGLNDSNERESVEECVDKIVNFVNNSLEVQLSKTDIDIAHRLGRYNKERPRTIICKFTHRRKKAEIIYNRRKLSGKGQVIFEDLTKRNQDILKAAYKLDSVKNTYSIDGKLFVVLKNGKKRRLQYDTELTDQYLADDRNFRIGSFD